MQPCSPKRSKPSDAQSARALTSLSPPTARTHKHILLSQIPNPLRRRLRLRRRRGRPPPRALGHRPSTTPTFSSLDSTLWRKLRTRSLTANPRSGSRIYTGADSICAVHGGGGSSGCSRRPAEESSAGILSAPKGKGWATALARGGRRSWACSPAPVCRCTWFRPTTSLGESGGLVRVGACQPRRWHRRGENGEYTQEKECALEVPPCPPRHLQQPHIDTAPLARVVLGVEDDFAMRLQLLVAVVTVASVLLEELEAMLEIMDPQPPGKQRSFRMNTW